MSLQQVAQHLAAQGTGTDTQLVHMSPKEVQALQVMAQKHGTSLSINPVTGLPQAGILDAILPAAAGIALTVGSGGTLSPLVAGLMVGGADYAMTGDLSKGLQAGLGAFGGAGLGAGLAGLGAETAAAGLGADSAMVASTPDMALGSFDSFGAATAPGSTAATDASAAITGTTSTPSYASNFGSGISNLFSNPSASFTQMGGLGGVGANAAMAASPLLSANSQNLIGPNAAAPTAANSNNSMITPYTFNRTPTGAPPSERQFNQSFTPQTPVPASEFKGFAAGGPIAVTAPTISAPQAISAPTMAAPQSYATGQLAAPTQAVQDFNTAMAAQAQSAYGNGINYAGTNQAQSAYGNGINYAGTNGNMTAPTSKPLTAYGPIAAVAPVTPVATTTPGSPQDAYGDLLAMRTLQGFDTGSGGGAAKGGRIRSYAMGGGIGQRYPEPDDNDMPQGAANGGIMGAHAENNPDAPSYPMQGTIGSYSDGGQLLKGPGTGQSDDIPATIGGKQPARLANEEFVVPADVVSMLGDGSSESGAKRLYEMLDRIRKAAHGKTTQQKKVDPKKVLPA